MQAIRRVTVPLSEAECDALRANAQRELRDPRDHARWLLRKALGLGNDNVQSNANRASEVLPDSSAVATK